MGSRLLDTLKSKLETDEPKPDGSRLAAVAMILRDEKTPSTLLIKRAVRQGDPWSGQIAFPGGRMEEGDKGAKETAIRETREEVGFDLAHTAKYLGHSDPVMTHTGTIRVVPTVFLLNTEVEVKENVEVASHKWVDLRDLFAPSARTTYKLSYGGQQIEMPAYAVGDYVVWGLTYRILSSVLADRE